MFIRKNIDTRRYEINIFGVKINIAYEKNIFNSIFQKILYPFIKAIFLYKHRCYISNKNDNITRRLFITTGNFNLINNLALIEQLNSENDNCSNDIIVWSKFFTGDFAQLNSKLATEIITINKYIPMLGCNYHQLTYEIVKNNMYKYDEIYYSNQDSLNRLAGELFPYAKLNLTDEGCCGLIKDLAVKQNRVANIYTAKYLNKMDYLGYSKQESKKIIELKRESFIKVSSVANKMYPIDLRCEHKNLKPIIFCGTLAGWGKDCTYCDIDKYQKNIIEKLINSGYYVLFKPHPRDYRSYTERDNFKVLNTKLPLECYQELDVLAVVSIFSSTSVQSYHYCGIPGFIDYANIKNSGHIGVSLISEYAMNVSYLFTLDVKNTSYAKLKELILNDYKLWLDKKELLSENKILNKEYNCIA